FDDAFVEQLRLGVMEQIASLPSRAGSGRLWLEWFTGNGRSGRRFVLATVVIVAAAALTLYVLSLRSPENGANTQTAAAEGTVHKTNPKQRQPPFKRKEGGRQRSRIKPGLVAVRHPGRGIPERPDLVAAVPGHVGSPTADPIEAARVSTNEGKLRIEIQTADPNIRIIWFAPKEVAEAPEPVRETR